MFSLFPLLHLTPVPACKAPRWLCVSVDLTLKQGSNLPLKRGWWGGGLLVFLLQIHFQKTLAEMLHRIPMD